MYSCEGKLDELGAAGNVNCSEIFQGKITEGGSKAPCGVSLCGTGEGRRVASRCFLVRNL